MRSNFADALSRVLVHEGGFVDHPKDPGGATNKGVTLATFRAYIDPHGTVSDLKAITDAQVATVYRDQYWNAVRGNDLPSGIDYAIFDFAVHSGPSRAAKHLQRAVGVDDDGKIGPVTLKAAVSRSAATVVNAVCDSRQSFLEALPTFKTFGNGWSKRVAGVRSHALALASQKPVAGQERPSARAMPPKPSLPASEPKTGLWQRFLKWLGF